MTRVRYLVQASQKQTITFNLTSPNIDSLSMGNIGQEDGQVYDRYEVKNTSGTFEVPATQGYYLDIYSTSGKSTEFTLEISLQ